jgi:hypothetical protein
VPYRTRSELLATSTAVHLGTVAVRITPTATNIKPVTLPVVVENPSGLGNDHNDFDAALTALAHRRGVPPQVLKGGR